MHKIRWKSTGRFCRCGCGQLVSKGKRFVHGHTLKNNGKYRNKA